MMQRGVPWKALVRRLGIALLALVIAAGSASAQGRGQGRGPGRGPGAGPRQESAPPAVRPDSRPLSGARAGTGPALLADSLPGTDAIGLLLLRRDSLQLTPSQVDALEQISTSLQLRNAPLVGALLEIRRELQPLIGRHPRDMSSAERQRFAREAERARPLMARLQQNNVAAMAEVGDVLTAPQKLAVRRWLQDSGMLEGGGRGAATGEPLRLRNRRGSGGGADRTDG
jgi:hypothetical protein